jgi:hypothetical protein
MGERFVLPKPVFLGILPVEILIDFVGIDTIHLNVGGSPLFVLGVGGPAYLFVVLFTTTARSDLDFPLEPIPEILQNHQSLVVHSVETTPTFASKFISAEIFTKVAHVISPIGVSNNTKEQWL